MLSEDFPYYAGNCYCYIAITNLTNNLHIMKALKSIMPLALLLLLLSALLFTGCQKEELDIAPKQFGPEFKERAVYLTGFRADKAIIYLEDFMLKEAHI